MYLEKDDASAFQRVLYIESEWNKSGVLEQQIT